METVKRLIRNYKNRNKIEKPTIKIPIRNEFNLQNGQDLSNTASTSNSTSKSYNTAINSQDLKYTNCSNAITTTKYTIYNFVFLNLYEQLSTRWANLYFLFIAIINFLPWAEVVGAELAVMPLIFIILVTMIKDAFEDFRRYKTDNMVNNQTCEKFDFEAGKFRDQKWKHLLPGDLIRIHIGEFIPADCLILNTTEEGQICYLQTSNLDGESNLKQFQAVSGLVGKQLNYEKNFTGQIDINLPTAEITNILGKLQLNGEADSNQFLEFNFNNCLLRDCILRNTDYVDCLILFTGKFTKTKLNTFQNKRKTSLLEFKINRLLPYNFLFIVILDILFCIGAYITADTWTKYGLDATLFYSPSNEYPNGPFHVAGRNFLTFIIAIQSLVPIALYVSWEIVKYLQIVMIHNDEKLYNPKTDKTARCQAMNITEDLGQIDYIFSDKTGTLTENVMIFRYCTIDGETYHETKTARYKSTDMPRFRENVSRTQSMMGHGHKHTRTKSKWLKSMKQKKVLDKKLAEKFKSNDEISKLFFICVATCHSALVAKDLEDDEKIRYESESVDELALLEFAQNYGVVMSKRSKTDIVVEFKKNADGDDEKDLDDEKELPVLGNLNSKKRGSKSFSHKKIAKPKLKQPWLETNHNFKILNFRKFTPKIKRMGIIVQDIKTNEIFYFVKGADEVILAMTHESEIYDNTSEHINRFASKGLRTLCMAYRKLSSAEYGAWFQNIYQPAYASLNEEIIDNSFNELEDDNMVLLGGTGIEDKLQEKVPSTIEFIRNSGLKLWVITGDKMETAVNIGKSTNLLETNDQLLIFNKLDSADDFAYQVLDSIPISIAIDGVSMEKIFTDPTAVDRFLSLVKKENFKTAIICRATPKLKADVVKLIKENLQVQTLSIGDGANDVAMLQQANIGVGLFGNEGLQAVMNSDFALTKFHHLKRLLFVHGTQNYERSSTMILYFFKKHFAIGLFSIPLMCYGGFFTMVPYDDLLFFTSNLLWNSLHPIINGIFDQFLSFKTLETNSNIYAYGQNNYFFNKSRYFSTIFYGLFAAIVGFFTALLMVNDSAKDITMFSHIAYIPTLLFCWFTGWLDIKSINIVHLITNLITIVGFIAFQIFLLYTDTSWFGVFISYGSYVHFWKIEFWLAVILSISVTTLPYYFYLCVKNYYGEDNKKLFKFKVDQQEQEGKGVTNTSFGSCFACSK